MSELKTLATVWLDGCSGCHMSLLDMDERLIELSSQFRQIGRASCRERVSSPV